MELHKIKNQLIKNTIKKTNGQATFEKKPLKKIFSRCVFDNSYNSTIKRQASQFLFFFNFILFLNFT